LSVHYILIWFAFGSHTPLSIHFHAEIHTKRGIFFIFSSGEKSKSMIQS
jgi:hypothetical protein